MTEGRPPQQCWRGGQDGAKKAKLNDCCEDEQYGGEARGSNSNEGSWDNWQRTMLCHPIQLTEAKTQGSLNSKGS